MVREPSDLLYLLQTIAWMGGDRSWPPETVAEQLGEFDDPRVLADLDAAVEFGLVTRDVNGCQLTMPDGSLRPRQKSRSLLTTKPCAGSTRGQPGQDASLRILPERMSELSRGHWDRDVMARDRPSGKFRPRVRRRRAARRMELERMELERSSED